MRSGRGPCTNDRRKGPRRMDLLSAVLERYEHGAEGTRVRVETPDAIGDVIDSVGELELRDAPRDHELERRAARAFGRERGYGQDA